ncbi:hypothetical protein BCV71DRAFT_171660 [Rhizopus microsporus]|uniref:PHD-type domain-containing protein n=1 Tax=Rhizopus microsporus TaxID=58291 RepID=A0A1X0SDX0_RHIZD|nr:hypothetical protein BCV71DRAFT_171660 [Rhizopus microsporus]
MSNTLVYNQPTYAYYTFYRQQQQYQPIMHVPIHHTLENATITYDTTIEQQKDLVKDVFFSPAMNDREMSPGCSTSSTSSQSGDDDDDDESTRCSPSELFSLDEQENLFDFGLELDKKPGFSLDLNQSRKFDGNPDLLPTPPAIDYAFSNKRRWSDSVLEQNNKKQRLQDLSTPPVSPALKLFDNSSYFDESDHEESSHNTEFQPFEQQEDDTSSIGSWEEDSEDDEYELYERKKQDKKNTVQEQQMHDHHDLPLADARPTSYPTIYQKLTKANIDWCRYCGTTEGVNWRPGPWGKRTLCNKHGCDYKGYGFACKLPRLNLTEFTRESIEERDRPVLQLYCTACQRKESWEGNVLVRCEGCPKAYHQKCFKQEILSEFVQSSEPWFCDESCSENSKRKRIVVELPRKRLPLMCAPSKITKPTF